MNQTSSFEKLKQFVSRLVEIPPGEWFYFISRLRVQQIKKGEFLFKEGKSSNMVGFVVSGLIHTFYQNQDGKERTKNFAWEGRLISPWASIIQDHPATFSAIALEQSYLVVLDSRYLKEMLSRHICWERLSRRCTEAVLIERERREYEVLMLSTLERYEAFLIQYNEIIERIPQHLIASFLGITPVALSRLLGKNRSPGDEI